MRIKKCCVALSSVASLAFTPHVAAIDLTPEQKQQLLMMMLGQGGQKPFQQGNTQQAQPLPQYTDKQLAAMVAEWPATVSGLKIEGQRDGFTVNGQRVIDPEGQIVKYGFDKLTGNVGYLVMQDQNQFLVKTMRAGIAEEAITIASAVRANGTWQVTTVTGKRLNGTRLTPTSQGFMVARANTGFLYQIGKGVSSFAGPEDFNIADFQGGDIASTQHILFERRKESQGTDSLSQLIGAAKALGSMVGVGTKPDYQLLDIKSNRVTALNIAIEDKTTTVGAYGCRQVNAFVRDCSNFEFAESLYESNGLPNYSHYFWRIQWYKTPTRNVVVALENGLRNVTVTDLQTGAKAVVFDRTMGIAGFQVNADSEGHINVTAKLGFSKETKSDVAALLDGTTMNEQSANKAS